MLSFLKGIFEFISALFDFVIDFISGIGQLAVNIAKLPELFTTIFSNGLIPQVVVSAVVSCLALMITLRIIGRDG